MVRNYKLILKYETMSPEKAVFCADLFLASLTYSVQFGFSRCKNAPVMTWWAAFAEPSANVSPMVLNCLCISVVVATLYMELHVTLLYAIYILCNVGLQSLFSTKRFFLFSLSNNACLRGEKLNSPQR